MGKKDRSADDVLRDMRRQEALRLKREENQLRRQANRNNSGDGARDAFASIFTSLLRFFMNRIFDGGHTNYFIRLAQEFIAVILSIIAFVVIVAVIIGICYCGMLIINKLNG